MIWLLLVLAYLVSVCGAYLDIQSIPVSAKFRYRYSEFLANLAVASVWPLILVMLLTRKLLAWSAK